MSHYFQLLGSDTPNGYGGCCYYGPLDHPAFQESPSVASLTSHSTNPKESAECPLYLAALAARPKVGATNNLSASQTAAAHVETDSVLQGHPASLQATHAAASYDKLTNLGAELQESSFLSSRATANDASLLTTTTTTTTADLDSPAWNWSSYLKAPRPTWPASGPLHSLTLLQPAPPAPGPPTSHDSPSAAASSMTPSLRDTPCVASAPLRPPVTADTGSSGNEGYIFFNCPEGTQRFSSEANIKLKKVRCFCFTRWNSTMQTTHRTSAALPSVQDAQENEEAFAKPLTRFPDTSQRSVGAASAAMGLPGMLFTINDAGSRQATFFGPSAGLDRPRAASHSLLAYKNLGNSALSEGRCQSEGLRGYLTALRFHYFQYRPMVFRQLHGVVACDSRQPDVALLSKEGGGFTVDVAKAKAGTLGNEVHYLETAACEVDTDDGATSTQRKQDMADPFIYATIPMSSQSLLVAFRVSGGSFRDEDGEGKAVQAGLADSVPSKSKTTSDSTDEKGNKARTIAGSFSLSSVSAPPLPRDYFTTYVEPSSGIENEQATSSSEADVTRSGKALYTLPDSSDVVLGYAVVVAPGSTFDAARARALGVRSGPKYGLLKQGIAVEADQPDSAGGGGGKAMSKALKKRLAKEKECGTPEAGEKKNETKDGKSNNTAEGRTAEGIEVAEDEKTTSTTPSIPKTAKPSDAPRWVHPHQVMRPTTATKHAYVSLVLDGDRPCDVQVALERLLGRASAGVHAPGRPGALMQLLQSRFPHLAYYYHDDDLDSAIGEERGNSNHRENASGEGTHADAQQARSQQRLRQVTVRHVAHVQPLSYFEDFTSTHASRDDESAEDASRPFATVGTTPQPQQQQQQEREEEREQAEAKMKFPGSSEACSASATLRNVYARYNAFVFANVTSKSICTAREMSDAAGDAPLPVQVGLSPSLSFTLRDLTDDNGDDGNHTDGVGVQEKGLRGARSALDTSVATTADVTVIQNSSKAQQQQAQHPQSLLMPTPCTRSGQTWQLFTSYVQQHYTAFPTALVHRYHLNHLAPTLFPLRGTNSPQRAMEVTDVRHLTKGTHVSMVCRADQQRQQHHHHSSSNAPLIAEKAETEYWPYSLKLRCIPEAALQLQSKKQNKQPSVCPPPGYDTLKATAAKSNDEANKKSGDDVKVQKTSTTPTPPLKRERKEGAAVNASTELTTQENMRAGTGDSGKTFTLTVAPQAEGKQCSAKNSQAAAPAALKSKAPAPLAVVDGQVSLLPYPTPSSALSLLSDTFLASLQQMSKTAGLQKPHGVLPRDGDGEEQQRDAEGVVAEKLTQQTSEEDSTHAVQGTGKDMSNMDDSRRGRLSGGALGFLGTGSAVPSKYRNVSGTYLELFLPGCCFGDADGISCTHVRSASKTEESDGAAGNDVPVFGSTAAPTASTATATAVRRGVVILDFGEGSLGQLASLCDGVREGVCGQSTKSSALSVEKNNEETAGVAGTVQDSASAPVGAREREHTLSAVKNNLDTASVTTTPAASGAPAGDRLRQFVLDIVLVFISHAHADHHLGLLSLLTLRHHYLHDNHDTVAARAQKLLIVLPTEVYQFVMDAWGNTAPYRSWLHEDCVFELMPPPVRGLATTSALTASLSAVASVDGEANLETAGDRRGEAVESNERDKDTLHSASSSDASGQPPSVPQYRQEPQQQQQTDNHHQHDHHHHHGGGDAQMQQHVVPVPLLQAQLRRWNRCIAHHLQAQQQQQQQQQQTKKAETLVTDAEQSAVSESVNTHLHFTAHSTIPQNRKQETSDAAVVAEAAAATSVGVWWDAEVITVDHPANAHALLLRFPFCADADLAASHSALGTAAATATLCVPRPHSALPNTSRVFLFSGDTRPSQFLVERSRAFTAEKTHPQHERVASTDAARTSPVFILLHEATFGPGFEGEAVRKKHSTLPEALTIGAAVAAEFVVLNHFSQRYPKLPGLSEEQLGGKSMHLVCQRRPRSNTAGAGVTVLETTAETNGTQLEAPQGVAESEREGFSEKAEESLILFDKTRTEEAESPVEALTEQKEGDEPEGHGDVSDINAAATASPTALYANMSFAFDLMSVSFADMHRGLVPRLTPALVRLLEEYDSWGVSTTHRMRTSRDGAGAAHSKNNSSNNKNKK